MYISDDVTVGTGNGSNTPTLGESFDLVSMSGSGNPPSGLLDQVESRLYYNKDLDNTQNIRNLFALVKGFKDALDQLNLASGYGGWTMITEDSDSSERVPGLLYLLAMNATEVINDPTNSLYYHIEPQLSDRKKMKFKSDATIVSYDNRGSYNLESTDVKTAIDELSNRSIILKTTIPSGAWEYIVHSSHGNYYKATINVPGMINTDFPIVTLDASSLSDDYCEQCAQAGHISRVQTLNDQIIAYCYDGYRPSINLNLIFRVLRGFPR